MHLRHADAAAADRPAVPSAQRFGASVACRSREARPGRAGGAPRRRLRPAAAPRSRENAACPGRARSSTGVGDLLAPRQRPRRPRNPVEAGERRRASPAGLSGRTRSSPSACGWRIVAEAAGVHAAAGCPRPTRIFAVDVVAVAGGDRRDAELAGDLQGDVGDLPLQVEAVVLDLDEVAVAEELLKPAGHDVAGLASDARSAPSTLPISDRLNSLDRQPEQADDAVAGMAASSSPVDAGLEVEALAGRPSWPDGSRLFEAGAVFGEQREVIARVLLACRRPSGSGCPGRCRPRSR